MLVDLIWSYIITKPTKNKKMSTKEFKHKNTADDYHVECDQCECALEPYQQIRGLCLDCRAENYHQLLDDCDAWLDDED